jgi:hypothetical protein
MNMMEVYETHYVSDCKSCPFHNDEHLVCLHPKRETRSLVEYCGGPLIDYKGGAPTWCPLRQAAVVIDLRENGG